VALTPSYHSKPAAIHHRLCGVSASAGSHSFRTLLRTATPSLNLTTTHHPTTSTMSFDLQWDHQFCLACDRQTDGATYCSESCRLADYEKTSSTPSSGASSPALAGPSQPWSLSSKASTPNKFYLSPALDFTNSRTYGSLSSSTSSSQAPRLLTPSSSHGSLSSLGSTTSTAEANQVSDKARRELRAYASSFEQVRLQRRRSY
jgi:hypothetical protein